MSNDSGKKPAKEWKILNGRLIQDINGFKQEIAMAVHQDRLDEIQGESTLVREVTPCANCERLESGNKMMRSALETIFNRRMSMYLKYEDMIEDQIKSADECLKAIAKEFVK